MVLETTVPPIELQPCIGGVIRFELIWYLNTERSLALLCLPISPNPINKKMAPRTGLEPVTYGLTVRRSTD